nr:MAG TPA: hypothetical protein [Caudoviricetes sp.]
MALVGIMDLKLFVTYFSYIGIQIKESMLMLR